MKLEFQESIIFLSLNLHYFLIYCNGWFFLSSVQQLIVQKKKTWVMWVGLLQGITPLRDNCEVGIYVAVQFAINITHMYR